MTGSKLSQAQKIISLMAKRRDSQMWFIPPDFMDPQLDYLFVGYEASARFSELAKQYPDMMESQPSTKYIKRRIRWESMDLWFSGLPKDIRWAFHRTGATKNLGSNGHSYEQIIMDESAPVPRPQTEPQRLFDLPPDKPKRNIMI